MSQQSSPVSQNVVVPQGTTETGAVAPLRVTGEGHLEVALHEPVTAFGEVLTAMLSPRIQIDAVYGLLTTDHEALTDGVSGTATAAASMFTATTGTSVGGYGVVRSRRLVRYRPGQGVRVRFTAKFDTGVANSLLVAGALNAEDALFVGYSGTTFGFMRRIAGAAHITRLTITNGATGAENITITLNGTPFVVASGGALSTTATAERIAEVGSFTGWSSSVSPTSNGATVTFIQGTPGTAAGAFTLSSTGGAVGTFSTVQAGAANDSATGFVAKTAWNIDRLDGSGGEYNPSGLLIDPTKLNAYELIVPYLGAGDIQLRVLGRGGEWHLCHVINYAGTQTVPSLKNPTFRVGWVAASLGSTTDLTVSGASGAAFVEGQNGYARDPFAASSGTFSASTTEYVALALRVRGEFASKLNQREVLPHTLFVSNETANRILVAKVYVNPTMTGTVNWQYVDQSLSAVEYAIPTTLTPSGGRLVAARGATTQGEVELHEHLLRLEPGDTLVITLATVTGAATGNATINWQEV